MRRNHPGINLGERIFQGEQQMPRVEGKFGEFRELKESHYDWLECNEQWGRVAWDEPGEIGKARASGAAEIRRLDFILGANKSHLKVLSGNITSFDLCVKLKEKSLCLLFREYTVEEQGGN